MRLLGQVRSEKSRSKATKGRYFSMGLEIMVHLFQAGYINAVAAVRQACVDDCTLEVAGMGLPNCHRTLGPATDR